MQDKVKAGVKLLDMDLCDLVPCVRSHKPEPVLNLPSSCAPALLLGPNREG